MAMVSSEKISGKMMGKADAGGQTCRFSESYRATFVGDWTRLAIVGTRSTVAEKESIMSHRPRWRSVALAAALAISLPLAVAAQDASTLSLIHI